MSFSDWVIMKTIDWAAEIGMEKVAEEIERRNIETRIDIVNAKRKHTRCRFRDGLAYEDFVSIAHKASNRIRRIKSVNVQGAVIYCTVESQTGYSNWDFKVDFNDWGHVTGTYWKWTENNDSNIPSHFGKMVSGYVHQFYRDRNISLPEYSDIVDEDKELGTVNGLNTHYKSGFFQKLAKEKQIISRYDSEEFIGEHVYVVVAMLRKNGYKNIKAVPVKDIVADGNKDMYEVELTVINGTSFFEIGDIFPENVEVIVTYHLKKQISIPYAMIYFKYKNYIDVGDQLEEMGFSNIYERKIKDLKMGWIIKDGSVEEILVNTDEGEKPFKRNEPYEFDVEIVITYHTYG